MSFFSGENPVPCEWDWCGTHASVLAIINFRFARSGDGNDLGIERGTWKGLEKVPFSSAGHQRGSSQISDGHGTISALSESVVRVKTWNLFIRDAAGSRQTFPASGTINNVEYTEKTTLWSRENKKRKKKKVLLGLPVPFSHFSDNENLPYFKHGIQDNIRLRRQFPKTSSKPHTSLFIWHFSKSNSLGMFCRYDFFTLKLH